MPANWIVGKDDKAKAERSWEWAKRQVEYHESDPKYWATVMMLANRKYNSESLDIFEIIR